MRAIKTIYGYGKDIRVLVALIAIFCGSGFLIPTSSAQADPCDPATFDHIFWKAKKPSDGTDVSTARGMGDLIWHKGWNLGSCEGAGAWAMNHMQLTVGPDGEMFEVGIQSFSQGAYRVRVLHGGQGQPSTEDYNGALTSTCPGAAIGDKLRFRVRFVTYKWEAHVKCPGSTVYKFLAAYDNSYTTGDSDGRPMTEAGRNGTVTDMTPNDHDNLDYQDSNGNWVSWADMGCHDDDAYSYKGSQVAVDHFATVKTMGDC